MRVLTNIIYCLDGN